MKLMLVSIDNFFPIAVYSLAAQLAAKSNVEDCSIDILHLDWTLLKSYEQKDREIWRYIARVGVYSPQVIGFSVYVWNHLIIRELVKITARVFPQVRIVLGGPEFATREVAEPWLYSGEAAVAVRGEGEHTFVEVVERLAQNDTVRGVQGTSWWDGKDVVHEQNRPPALDLSEFASPYLDGWVSAELFDREDIEPGTALYSRALLQTYRGCYMNCSYCQWGASTNKRVSFPKERLMQEISWLLAQKVRKILVIDAMFGYSKSIAKSLLQHVISEKRRLGVHTRIILYHNQDFSDPELLDLYREAEAIVEIDLQSTNSDVLNCLGRGRWGMDVFDRHIKAFKEHGVSTSGAADLIIGIPGDNLASFEESVNFLLRRGLRVNLYNGSVLPDTGWSRKIVEDGTIYSPIPPRSIFCNATFGVSEMLIGRLIGHGVDLFNRLPCTMQYLWRWKFDRPVDLCREIGEAVYAELGLMYGDTVLGSVTIGHEEAIAKLILDLCPDKERADIMFDLFNFEVALDRMTDRDYVSDTLYIRRAEPIKDWEPSCNEWLHEYPRFCGDLCKQIDLSYRVDQMVEAFHGQGRLLSLDVIARDLVVALVFNDGKPGYFIVDRNITHRLIKCFNGFFSVEECLDKVIPDWHQITDLSPVWKTLSCLASFGLIEPAKETDALRFGRAVAR